MQNGLASWEKPDTTHYGVAGAGFYPAIESVSIKKGSAIMEKFFVHAGFGVRTYQGLQIIPQQADDNKGVSVTLTGSEFLLGPTFPKFAKNWAASVGTAIAASPNAQPGEHVFKFTVGYPSAQKSAEWRAAVPGNYYETAMSGAGIEQTISVYV